MMLMTLCHLSTVAVVDDVDDFVSFKHRCCC